MDKATANKFKLKFIDMLNELTHEQADLFTELNNGDVVDRTNNERAELLRLKLDGRKSFLVKKILSSLRKIENGEFGICCECGDEISISRLEARPMATKCIACKEDEEREENHIPYSKRSHTLGKTIRNDNAEIDLGEEVKGTKTFAFDKSKKKLGLGTVLPA